MPSEFNLVHSFSQEIRREFAYPCLFFIRPKGKQVLKKCSSFRFADKTNPSWTMTAAPLKPYTEKKLYSKGKLKKGGLEVDTLIQLMA